MRSYSTSEIEKSLIGAGVHLGDNLFVSTGLGFVGVPSDVSTQEQMNQVYLNAICNVIGKQGTVFVPTYSYTAGNSVYSHCSKYDPLSTESQIGPFPNFFLKQDGVIRSLDPMMSVAALGPEADVIHDHNNSSYGEGCLFSLLLKVENMKCLNIGIGANFTPFVHYADWLMKAPYRYDKLFSVCINGKKIVWHYSVRIAGKEGVANCYRLAECALKDNIWKQVSLGRSTVSVCDYKKYFDFTLYHVNKDRWFLADGPEEDPVALEECRYPVVADLAHVATAEELVAIIDNKPLPVAGKAIGLVVNAIATIIDGEVWRIKTGEWVGDWIVPEYWYPIHCRVIAPDGSPVTELDVMPDSLTYQGRVQENELAKHLHVQGKEFPYVLHRCDRDWGVVSNKNIDLQKGDYSVTIDCVRGMGYMPMTEVLIHGIGKHETIIFIDLERRVDAHCPECAILIAIKLIELLRKEGTGINYRFIFAPGNPGFLFWYSKVRNIECKITALVSINGNCLREDIDKPSLSKVNLIGGSDQSMGDVLFNNGLNPLVDPENLNDISVSFLLKVPSDLFRKSMPALIELCKVCLIKQVLGDQVE